MHSGNIEVSGSEYVGRPLNRAARLLAAAHGGQILLSGATQALVRDELTGEVELRELGEYRLKDLIHPEHIYQAIAPQLPTEFPPLATLDAFLNNLPAQPTPLIDREAEVASVCNLLRRSGTRIVTLVGPGGVGKTRLALQVAAELSTAYSKGVYFIPLSSLRDLQLVAPTIAQTLGVTEGPERSLMDALNDFLRTKQVLLVLDNFEQVVGAALLVSELLATAPRLSVLVTSRTTLHLRGEKVFTVLPLGLPDSQHALALATISQYAAVQLFIERARDINPDLEFTSDTNRAVAEICSKLDGLPLAIELAAARVKLFSPEALLVRLEQRLTLLTDGARDLPVRQQTLRNTIDWSYQLLDPAEQVLFRRLAVFSSSFTVVAAFAVCNPTDETQLDVLNGLSALVDQSMLRRLEIRDNESRFEMLETVREYALQQLVMNGESAMVERLHANFFLAFAEAAEPKLFSKDQRVWLERLEADHQNLRSALGWALEWKEAEIALRLSGALWQFWNLRGCMEEGRTWLSRALAISESEIFSSLTVLRATVLYREGFLANYQGSYSEAAKLCSESLSLFQTLGDTHGLSWALYTLGSVTLFQGDPERAGLLLEQSLALFREQGDARGIGWSLNDLGLVALEQADLERATLLLEESQALFRDVGSLRDIATSQANLGNVAQELGNINLSEAYFTSALELLREAGDKGMAMVGCLANLGEMAQAHGDMKKAKAHLIEAISLAQDLGTNHLIAFGLMILSWIATEEEQYVRAAQLISAEVVQQDILTARIGLADRATYDRYLAIVKTQLGPTRFAAVWDAGQSMTTDQVIAYALAEIP